MGQSVHLIVAGTDGAEKATLLGVQFEEAPPQGLKPVFILEALMYGLKPVPFQNGPTTGWGTQKAKKVDSRIAALLRSLDSCSKMWDNDRPPQVRALTHRYIIEPGRSGAIEPLELPI